MHPEFWHQRWRNNEIGFHEPHPLPLLCKHWPALALPETTRVFVPLCGKSLDMAWLAAQGHPVLGVELSAVAVEAFFAGQGVVPDTFDSRYGRHYLAELHGNRVELICGDAFALDAQALAGCGAIYDRAALVALPDDLRERYVAMLCASLPADCRGLLITLEYARSEMSGPPFPVDEDEVRARFGRWLVAPLERRDILTEEPGFAARGLRALRTAVYRLDHRPPPSN